MPGIDQAFVNGSWAARYRGEPGPARRDIDLLVIGEPDLDGLYAAYAKAHSSRSSAHGDDKGVQEMIVEGRLDRVSKSSSQGGRMLRACLQHLETADQRAAADPSGSYALLYDAARKAVAAHMLFHGLRVTNRPGAHAAIVAYAEAELAAIGEEHVAHLDRMRRTRNDTEYDERPISEQEVRNDLAHARFLVQAIAKTLFPPKGNPAKRTGQR